jgi:predicted GIY-YIG superfamily endonuclease
MKLQRLHQNYPIFTTMKQAATYSIYLLQDTLDSDPWYVGQTTDAIARYKKRVIGATGSAYFLNDSRECLDRFKSVYKPGTAPIMLIVAGTDDATEAKQLEKHYREKYNDTIINKVTGRTPYKRDQYHRHVWTIADKVYDFKYGLLTIALFFIAVSILFYTKSNTKVNNEHDFYTYPR